jgi:hypothetical protein
MNAKFEFLFETICIDKTSSSYLWLILAYAYPINDDEVPIIIIIIDAEVKN